MLVLMVSIGIFAVLTVTMLVLGLLSKVQENKERWYLLFISSGMMLIFMAISTFSFKIVFHI